MLFAGQPSLRSGSRFAGEKASPPPPRVTFVNAAMFRLEDTSTSMFLLQEKRFVPIAKNVAGANGGVLFLWERLSERSEDRPEADSY